MASETKIKLEAPAPIAPVTMEAAAGLVPVDAGVKGALEAKVDAFVANLVAQDANSPEFGKQVDRLSNLGQKQIAEAAGQSNRGMKFAAEYADYNFLSGTGINTPQAFAPHVERLRAATAASGRKCGALALTMIIADETDEAAMRKWEHYCAGTDLEALAWRDGQAAEDVKAEAHSTVGRMVRAERQPTIMVRLIGSYATVARLLDEMAEIPGLQGAMLTFDDYLVGLEQFGTRIQPLMRSRSSIAAAA
jgi:alkanesulfonate monooxygenase SsuD/methylene tetrahydromethanopterin reductase-like flavin-dependent oxidoreductase (luciferase family)